MLLFDQILFFFLLTRVNCFTTVHCFYNDRLSCIALRSPPPILKVWHRSPSFTIGQSLWSSNPSIPFFETSCHHQTHVPDAAGFLCRASPDVILLSVHRRRAPRQQAISLRLPSVIMVGSGQGRSVVATEVEPPSRFTVHRRTVAQTASLIRKDQVDQQWTG